jgi:hypothetical protein
MPKTAITYRVGRAPAPCNRPARRAHWVDWASDASWLLLTVGLLAAYCIR